MGALLKVVDNDGNFGVADVCPWPSLGDLDLESELSQRGPLFQRAVVLAVTDLDARKNQVHLVDRTEVENHFLITDTKNFDAFAAEAAEVVKIKGSKDYLGLAQWLIEHASLFKIIRLDFNGCLSEPGFEKFLDLLSVDILKKIELVEDPFPFQLDAWTRLSQKIKIAADFIDSDLKKKWPVVINKPAREAFDINSAYLTSSMDHPVGIAHGLHFAQKLPNKVHGFLTFDKYDPTEYTAAFVTQGTQLTYESDGYGIGYTELLAKENWVPQIDWKNNQETKLLFNPQSNSDHIRALFEIKKKFQLEHPENYILIPSSGSTLLPGDHRVFAFHRQKILNSAARVNQQFGLTQKFSWGCVLPLFHVGGLGILARAHLSESKIYFNSWKNFSIEWMTENNINLMSVVPTQIFDLVAKGLRAPPCAKFIFVGGAALDEQLYKEAVKLGWPLILTYGMTETASMIASKKLTGFFEFFEGVKIICRENKYFVMTDSTADFQVNYSSGSININSLDAINLGIELPDAIEFFENKKFSILGRSDDQIKINGELVNLDRIRNLIPKNHSGHLEVIAIDDSRKGKRIVLVAEKIKIEDLKLLAVNMNTSLNKFEKIELVKTVDHFPRTALYKIKRAELKMTIEKENAYETL
jgi:o-succinylbenzoate---CoA ligase